MAWWMWAVGLGIVLFLMWWSHGRNAASTAPAVPVDQGEDDFYGVAVRRRADLKVRIRYEDSNGERTERVVDIKAFEPEGSSALFFGRCELRQAMRTFRFDRVRQAVELDGGELLPSLQRRLGELWEKSPDRALDELAAGYSDELRVLLFVARADGAMRAAEVDAIASYARRLTGDARITSPMLRELFQYRGEPSLQAFRMCYNRLRRSKPEAAAALADVCREIVATQKTVHPGERAALDYLDSPLPPLGKK